MRDVLRGGSFFFFFGGGEEFVYMQAWGRRKRNMGGKGRQHSDILMCTDEKILSVTLTAILLVKWTRHCTEIPI